MEVPAGVGVASFYELAFGRRDVLFWGSASINDVKRKPQASRGVRPALSLDEPAGSPEYRDILLRERTGVTPWFNYTYYKKSRNSLAARIVEICRANLKSVKFVAPPPRPFSFRRS